MITTQQGIERGMEKGLQKAKFLIAAKMKKQGLSTDMIAQLNGLTTEIETLWKENIFLLLQLSQLRSVPVAHTLL